MAFRDVILTVSTLIISLGVKNPNILRGKYGHFYETSGTKSYPDFWLLTVIGSASLYSQRVISIQNLNLTTFSDQNPLMPESRLVSVACETSDSVTESFVSSLSFKKKFKPPLGYVKNAVLKNTKVRNYKKVFKIWIKV